MLERLIEFWLDNASERSYQEPFCQMLVGLGHKVAHSTRHSPIELGKDVISLDPKGQVCAFQLKGNPGGRLTLSQFRDIEAQLFELAAQPVGYGGGVSERVHKSYLVTNGHVDEEARLAIQGLNTRLKRLGLRKNAVEIWARGDLLRHANALGASLWPSELSDIDAFLRVLGSDGKGEFPYEILHQLLVKVLRLEPGPKARASVEEMNRRISSAALLVELCLGKFRNSKNYQAVIEGLTMTVSYTVACASKYGFSLGKNGSASISIAKAGIRQALSDMCDELIANPKLGSALGFDFQELYQARLCAVASYMAVYWLWSERDGWRNEEHRDFINSWMPRLSELPVWGEAVIPQLLTIYWQRSAANSTSDDEMDLATVARTVVDKLRNPDLGLAGPYYSFSDVMAHKFKDVLGDDDPLKRESMHGMSYTAEGLMHLMVRANLKWHCKALWPSFNSLTQAKFSPAKPWQYCLWRSDEGNNPSVLLEHTQRWDALVELARDCRLPNIPTGLWEDEFILALFLIQFPYRLSSETVRFLGHKLGTVWFIPPAITE